jgi:hypothetical protein
LKRGNVRLLFFNVDMDIYDMFFKKFNQGEKGMIQIYKGPGIFIKLLILEAWKTS